MTTTFSRSNSATARPDAFTLVELLVTIVIVGILAAILLPVLAGARNKAHNILCLNNLRQLGIAARLYAGDDNATLPAAEFLPSNPTNPQKPLPRISDLLAQYAGRLAGTNASASVFKCPNDSDFYFEVEGSSYQWNSALNGRRIDLGEKQHTSGIAVSNGVTLWQTNFDFTFAVESTPLFLDYDDFHPRPPKSGKNVVYMDGHVARFDPSALP
jgi:prepilin-type N-terminal cleavage/methylation domain-containing protein/prepilin-type processing-associated H-X9-DG protein